jgi:NAD(P)-dependent dehydrogenase (short-subunit alcohol dehydrogenase family)
MNLHGASALVTGGASGLGRATAAQLQARGARVVIMDLPQSPGTRVAAELGTGALFVPGDVTEPAEVERAVHAAVDLAPLRVAVAAAGVVPVARLFDAAAPLPTDRIASTLAVNVLGTYHVLAHAGFAMSTNVDGGDGSGVIVCTSSIAAYDGQIGHVGYAASKGAVASMTLPAARELARHRVRVVSVAPGMFDTPVLAGLPEKARAAAVASVPYPVRLGDPTEFAHLVLHVVDNTMLNGEVIRLDGALRMAPR